MSSTRFEVVGHIERSVCCETRWTCVWCSFFRVIWNSDNHRCVDARNTAPNSGTKEREDARHQLLKEDTRQSRVSSLRTLKHSKRRRFYTNSTSGVLLVSKPIQSRVVKLKKRKRKGKTLPDLPTAAAFVGEDWLFTRRDGWGWRELPFTPRNILIYIFDKV